MNEETKSYIEKSSIKLLKNTKGYNWEIRLVQGITEEEVRELQDKLFIANEFMITKTSELI